MEDTSYNLTNIKNFSQIIEYRNRPYIDSLFTIFQYGITYDVSIDRLDTTKRVFDISDSCNVDLNDLLANNKFEEFYKYLIIDLTIDELYEKFKHIIELYPSFLLRKIRNAKIKSTDFIMLEDFEIDETEKQKWKNYRAQLRNITNNLQNDEIIFVDDCKLNVEWPTVPNVELLLISGYYDLDN